MSLSILIPEARRIVVQDTGVTSLVPASKISFSQRPQGDTLPGIILNMGTVEYEPVFENSAIKTVYRVDYLSYDDSAQTTAAIHEAVKAAVLAFSSFNFHIRLFDESYFVDVDMIHRAQLSVNFYYSP
jgi:hypothetical protein